jgi:regulator of RNase E activity RraA
MSQTHKEITRRLLALDTAIVCDVFDEKGWTPLALDNALRCRTEPTKKLAGYAYTIEGQFTVAKGADRLKLQVVDQIPSGSVAVWAGTNARGICLFGDLLATRMHANGCHGAIVDGGFRDSRAISELGFPVYSKYVTPVQAVGRWRVTRHQEPVYLPGAFGELIEVHPGDYLLADHDGVVVIPQEKAVEVLERAEAIVASEAEARKLGSEGLSSEEMLERFGHV